MKVSTPFFTVAIIFIISAMVMALAKSPVVTIALSN